jgi:acyl-coenzyme A thioesterase PaaI-like protein
VAIPIPHQPDGFSLCGVFSGWVTGTVRPLQRGRTTHVCQIELRNATGNMTCISRITMAILAPAG